MKKILIASIMILGIIASGSIVNADPIIDSITLDPSDPAPESTITFTAYVSNDTIAQVYLVVKECKDNFCFEGGFNESMTKITSDKYQKEIKLTRSDVNNIEYWLVINCNGTWYDFQDDFKTTNLKITSGNGESKKTPGFEIIILFISIGILLFLIKPKRV